MLSRQRSCRDASWKVAVSSYVQSSHKVLHRLTAALVEDTCWNDVPTAKVRISLC